MPAANAGRSSRTAVNSVPSSTAYDWSRLPLAEQTVNQLPENVKAHFNLCFKRKRGRHHHVNKAGRADPRIPKRARRLPNEDGATLVGIRRRGLLESSASESQAE
jgi:hypothetical protein